MLCSVHVHRGCNEQVYNGREHTLLCSHSMKQVFSKFGNWSTLPYDDTWTSLLLDMDLHFALYIPGRNFAAPKQHFRWNFFKISSYVQNNLGQDLSFEGSNTFVGKLEVSFWALWKKNPFSACSCDPLILIKLGEICNLPKNHHVRVD